MPKCIGKLRRGGRELDWSLSDSLFTLLWVGDVQSSAVKETKKRKKKKKTNPFRILLADPHHAALYSARLSGVKQSSSTAAAAAAVGPCPFVLWERRGYMDAARLQYLVAVCRDHIYWSLSLSFLYLSSECVHV